MSALTYDQLDQVAECLVEPKDIQAAIQNLAVDINAFYRDLFTDKNTEVIVWSVLNGGLIFTGYLLPMLTLTVRLDYVHASRYQNNIGGELLSWIAKPVQSVAGKHVLICDDIFDAGITLEAITDYAFAQGAKSVQSAVLASKLIPRSSEVKVPRFQALTVADRYVFGMGLDYNNHWRNLPGIWALKEG